MTKKEHFASVMTMLAETFGRSLTDATLDGYWLVLEELSEEELRAAAKGALSTQKFMPSPAELRAFVRSPRNPNADVVNAWQVVRKAIDVHDYLVASIDFGPLVNAVIRNLGGWDTMCRATLPELDNPGWLRKRFDEIYKSLATSDPQTLHGDPLDGALPPRWVGGKHVTVSLDGKPERLRIEANGVSDARASITAHIQELANGKSPDAE